VRTSRFRLFRDKALVAYILVVEDDDECRSAVSELLMTHGFDVHEARDGRAALDHMLSREEPALVVLDLDMPVLSGTELLKLMDSYYRLSRIPVLVVSGRVREATPRHAGVVAVISKPFDASSFVETVKAHVGNVSGSFDGR
jgi:CheY-like chemotaxis protein